MPARDQRVFSAVWIHAAACAALLCGAAAVRSSQPAARAQTMPAVASGFREEVIGELSPGSEVDGQFVGDHHLAWIEKAGGKRIVRLDGKQQGGAYDEVEYWAMNQDESHFAFLGKRNGAWVLVLDGKEQSQEYKKATSLAFQPHGNSIAYGGCNAKKCRLVVDNAETGAEYEDISFPQYSRDGLRLAFFGKRAKKWLAIVDGKETGPELDDFWPVAWGFNRDASRFYVAGWVKPGWTYVVNGQPGLAFDVISPIAFSRDGSHFAYGGTNAIGGFKKQKTIGTIVVDGHSTDKFEGKGLLGAWTVLGGSTQMIATGVRVFTTDFHGISDPQFNPEGKLVYAARRDKGDVAVLVESEAGPGFDEILSPVAFSEDSQHFVYVAREGDQFVEVRDNLPGRPFSLSRHEATDVQWIALTADATHVAFETVSGGKQYKAGTTTRALRSVIIDGHAGAEYDALNLARFEFDRDAHHYFYEVVGAKGNRDIVNVDGHESKLYDSAAHARFSEDHKTMSFVARDARRFLRVTYAFE